MMRPFGREPMLGPFGLSRTCIDSDRSHTTLYLWRVTRRVTRRDGWDACGPCERQLSGAPLYATLLHPVHALEELAKAQLCAVDEHPALH